MKSTCEVAYEVLHSVIVNNQFELCGVNEVK